MGNRVQVLDHGYVEFIEAWGSDERIVEAARMSTDKGFRTWEPYTECGMCGAWWADDDLMPCDDPPKEWRKVPNGDMGLLRYLRTNRHTTPFEMIEIWLEMKNKIRIQI